MGRTLRMCLLLAAIFSSFFLIMPAAGHAGPLKFDSSTQYLWGDDMLGNDQSIIAQYMRFSYNPEGKNISVTGYGRVWQDFKQDSRVRNDDTDGRLYYLNLDYAPSENIGLRLGRQYINFSSGSAIMDGARVDINKIGPVGITVAGGSDVIFSLDAEHSRTRNYLAGVDLHLVDVRPLQFGVSYLTRYDDGDPAREEFGTNFRWFYKILSPYAEIRYDNISKTFDESQAGIDFFPVSGLSVKTEFYQLYPTFDSTSIYSVFAVDKYREYTVKAEYAFDAPVSVFVSYVHQTYEDSDEAENYLIGSKFSPVKDLSLSLSLDRRTGYDGKLWGFEATGDYRFKKFAAGAGVQYDTYTRPDQFGNNYAQRYWVGGKWFFSEKGSLIGRVEENVNENFEHRLLGRLMVNWNF